MPVLARGMCWTLRNLSDRDQRSCRLLLSAGRGLRLLLHMVQSWNPTPPPKYMAMLQTSPCYSRRIQSSALNNKPEETLTSHRPHIQPPRWNPQPKLPNHAKALTLSTPES